MGCWILCGTKYIFIHDTVNCANCGINDKNLLRKYGWVPDYFDSDIFCRFNYCFDNYFNFVNSNQLNCDIPWICDINYY